jgi:glycine betaine catabolism A
LSPFECTIRSSVTELNLNESHWRASGVCHARNSRFMQSAKSMRAALKAHGSERALPRDFYIHPEYFSQELHSLWYREWLFIGLECELANEGDYLTTTVGEYAILVLRDSDGAFRAFHNICRQCGSRICAAEHGSTSRLMCPHHQWAYRLNGTLLATRDMGADINCGEQRLKALHCAALAGYIFVCLAERAPDFDAFARAAEPYLLPHHVRDAKVAFESTIVEHANWKLVWENNRECYHCTVNHPELARTFPSTPTVMGLDAATADPRLAVAWQRWEELGLPSQFKLAGGGQSRLMRMPLIEGMVSFTVDGGPASRRPLSDSVTAADVGSLLMFHYPSTWNHILGDHATVFRLLPLSATETQLTTKWLVHKDAREGLDYDVERLTHVWRATNDQDRRVCQENQLGVNSPAYEPAPYSPVHEAGVMQFMDWYRHCLLGRLGDEPA